MLKKRSLRLSRRSGWSRHPYWRWIEFARLWLYSRYRRA